jgi:hypothetical protein
MLADGTAVCAEPLSVCTHTTPASSSTLPTRSGRKPAALWRCARRGLPVNLVRFVIDDSPFEVKNLVGRRTR